MKYSQKYAAVAQGVHASDERFYRADAVYPCSHCGVMTEWVDVVLTKSVCSEECHYVVIRAVKEAAPAQPLLGQLLVKEGLITEAQLEQALVIQQSAGAYIPLGRVLTEQKFITLKQLNRLLDRYRKRPKLGAVLVAAKVITTDQLQQAVLTQGRSGVRLGDVLRRLGLATEAQIKQAICVQLNLPFLDLRSFRLDLAKDLAKLIKPAYARRCQIVPIARLGDTLTLAMDDPTDAEVIRVVEASTGFVVNVVTATKAGIHHALAQVYG
jgi:type IV pilus assembly protein PilB